MQLMKKLQTDPCFKYEVQDACVHIQQCVYRCPGAKAPGHQ